MALDFDNSDQRCIYQYNYSHDDEGGFLSICCDGNGNGNIARYGIFASEDGRNWKVITEGTWENTDRPQTVQLENPTTAGFFKLEALQEVRSRNWTSVAECSLASNQPPYFNG